MATAACITRETGLLTVTFHVFVNGYTATDSPFVFLLFCYVEPPVLRRSVPIAWERVISSCPLHPTPDFVFDNEALKWHSMACLAWLLCCGTGRIEMGCCSPLFFCRCYPFFLPLLPESRQRRPWGRRSYSVSLMMECCVRLSLKAVMALG